MCHCVPPSCTFSRSMVVRPSVPTPGLILVHYRDSGKKRHEGLCRISRRKRTRRSVSDVGVPATDRPTEGRPSNRRAGLASWHSTVSSLESDIRKTQNNFRPPSMIAIDGGDGDGDGKVTRRKKGSQPTRFSARENSPSIRSASGTTPLSE